MSPPRTDQQLQDELIDLKIERKDAWYGGFADAVLGNDLVCVEDPHTEGSIVREKTRSLMEVIAGWFVKSTDAKRSKGNDGNVITPRSDYDY